MGSRSQDFGGGGFYKVFNYKLKLCKYCAREFNRVRGDWSVRVKSCFWSLQSDVQSLNFSGRDLREIFEGSIVSPHLPIIWLLRWKSSRELPQCTILWHRNLSQPYWSCLTSDCASWHTSHCVQSNQRLTPFSFQETKRTKPLLTFQSVMQPLTQETSKMRKCSNNPHPPHFQTFLQSSLLHDQPPQEPELLPTTMALNCQGHSKRYQTLILTV